MAFGFSACDKGTTTAHLTSWALQTVCKVGKENTEWTPGNGQAFPVQGSVSMRCRLELRSRNMEFGLLWGILGLGAAHLGSEQRFSKWTGARGRWSKEIVGVQAWGCGPVHVLRPWGLLLSNRAMMLCSVHFLVCA